MASQERNAKNEPGGGTRRRARQEEYVGSHFLLARERKDTNDALPPSVERLQAPLPPAPRQRTRLDKKTAGARSGTVKGIDIITPSRKRLGISLLPVPILLLALLLPTSIEQSSDNAGTTSQTTVSATPQTEVRADAHAPGQPRAPDQEQRTAAELRSEAELARRELDKVRAHALTSQAVATKQSQAATVARKENDALREEVNALRSDMNRINAEVGAQRALTAMAVKEQTTKAAALMGDLVLARRELQRMGAAHTAIELSLAAKVDALEEQRLRARLAERDLATSRQSMEQLKTSAQVASKRQADLLERAQIADAAAKQSGVALEVERERARALAHSLEAAHRDRIVTEQELAQALVASKQAVDLERKKAGALTRDLASARKDIDALTRRVNRRVTKAIAAADTGRRPALRRSEANAITLPNSLRPTRPPVDG